MHSREQYLARVREEYRTASKRTKTRLLNDAKKRIGLNRKVLVRKLAHPTKADPGKSGPRKATYGADVVTALVKVWPEPVRHIGLGHPLGRDPLRRLST